MKASLMLFAVSKNTKDKFLVEEILMGHDATMVRLVEKVNLEHAFDFSFIHDGKEVDIYKSRLLNPYIYQGDLIHYVESPVKKQHTLDEAITVVKKYLKMYRDSYKKANDEDAKDTYCAQEVATSSLLRELESLNKE